MSLDDVEKIWEKFKAQPIRTVIILLILALAVVILAYLTNYWGEKGKADATTSKTNTQIAEGQKEISPKNETNDNGVTINQSTYGPNSPTAVITGDQTIEYNITSPKKE